MSWIYISDRKLCEAINCDIACETAIHHYVLPACSHPADPKPL